MKRRREDHYFRALSLSSGVEAAESLTSFDEKMMKKKAKNQNK